MVPAREGRVIRKGMPKQYDLTRPRRSTLGAPDSPPPAIPQHAQHVPIPAVTQPQPRYAQPFAAAPAPSRPAHATGSGKRETRVARKIAKAQREKGNAGPREAKREPVTSMRLQPHVRAAFDLLVKAMGTSKADYLSQHVMRDYALLRAGGLITK